MPDESPVTSRSRLSASEIAHRSFTTVRRGLDPEEVRSFLSVVAEELEAAELTMEAHLRAEEAEGVARAVSLARSSEPWSPRGPHADMEALLQAETAARATM